MTSLYRENAIKWILLDVWGVIFSILNFVYDLLIPFLQQKGINLSKEEIYRIYRKASLGEIDADQFWKDLGIIYEIKGVEGEYLDSFSVSNPEFKDVAHELIPNFKLGIISNDVERWSLNLLDNYGILDYFSYIGISSSLKMRKPNPEVFMSVLNDIGEISTECLFIDDRLENLNSAYSIGMKPIHFVRNKNKTPFCSEFEVSSFQELKKVLEAFF